MEACAFLLLVFLSLYLTVKPSDSTKFLRVSLKSRIMFSRLRLQETPLQEWHPGAPLVLLFQSARPLLPPYSLALHHPLHLLCQQQQQAQLLCPQRLLLRTAAWFASGRLALQDSSAAVKGSSVRFIVTLTSTTVHSTTRQLGARQLPKPAR